MRLPVQITLLVSAVALTSGFVPTGGRVPRANLIAQASSQDAELEARKAENTFGAQSNEAKTAWDIVEEIRAAEAGNPAVMPNLDELCSLEESELCERYQKQLDELEKIIKAAETQGSDVIARLVAENAVLLKEIEELKKN